MEQQSLSNFQSRFWRRNVFFVVSTICVLFVLLTTGAMLLYPGGNHTNPETSGYSFFYNFFSDLGRTVAHDDKPNTIAALMFTTALGSAGFGLILFFLSFRQFFHRQLWLSSLGTAMGMIAGICFIGVAFTPANIYGPAHGQFVNWAFRMFLFASLMYSFAIHSHKQFPRALGFVFVLFCGILTNYVVLLTKGPPLNSAQGVLIQATGQKIIAYSAIICVFIQSVASIRINQSASPVRTSAKLEENVVL